MQVALAMRGELKEQSEHGMQEPWEGTRESSLEPTSLLHKLSSFRHVAHLSSGRFQVLKCGHVCEGLRRVSWGLLRP